MKIEDALLDWLLNEYKLVAISRQDLLVNFLRMWIDKKYKNESIENITARKNPFRTFERWCKTNERKKIITGDKWSTKGYRYYLISNRNKEIDRVVCAIYPFGYLAYLSAIQHYKLVSYRTSSTYFVCPNRSEWKSLCLKRLKTILPEWNEKNKGTPFFYVELHDLIPTYPVEEEILNSQVILLNQKKNANFETWKDIRVEYIIDLYVDMLRNPQFCGGLEEVIKIYNQTVDRYLEAIIALLNSSYGTQIDRARFGFICEKYLHIKHPAFEKWKEEQKDKRGGSRKLVASLEFDPIFDEDWNISINHEFAKNIPPNRTINIKVDLPTISVTGMKILKHS
jgi:predicted transcriptional regulator of viral defense system